MAFGNNILEQRNPQATLQPEEELQITKFLMDRAADAVFWVNSDARFLYVNDTGCCMAGYSREELLSQDLRNCHSERWVQQAAQERLGLMLGATPVRGVTPV